MKKLLAIILTIVCIIPTMAVSFSVSAKAASNQVKTTNVSLYQYGESTYTQSQLKSTITVTQLTITMEKTLLLQRMTQSQNFS